MCLFLRCVQISRSRMKGQHAAGLALLILSSCAIQGYSLPQNRWILSSLVKQRFFNNCAGIQQRSMQGSLVPLQQRKTLPMTLTTRSRLPRRRGACSTLSWKLPWSSSPWSSTPLQDPPGPARLTGFFSPAKTFLTISPELRESTSTARILSPCETSPTLDSSFSLLSPAGPAAGLTKVTRWAFSSCFVSSLWWSFVRWARCSRWWAQWSEPWLAATTPTRWPWWPSRRARWRYRICHPHPHPQPHRPSTSTPNPTIHIHIHGQSHILTKYWHCPDLMNILGGQLGGHLGGGPHHLYEPEVIPRLCILRRRIGDARIREFQNQHILPELFLLWFKVPPMRMEQIVLIISEFQAIQSF